jgi:hypothetical protein
MGLQPPLSAILRPTSSPLAGQPAQLNSILDRGVMRILRRFHRWAALALLMTAVAPLPCAAQERGYFGVSLQDLDPERARALALDNPAGALVIALSTISPLPCEMSAGLWSAKSRQPHDRETPPLWMLDPRCCWCREPRE